MTAELAPLGELGLGEALEDVVAQGGADHLVLFHLGHRFAKRRRQDWDIPSLQVLVGEVVEIFLDRFREGHLILDAVDSGGKHRRKCQVRIAARVGAAKLDPGRGGVATPDGRHPDQRRAVRAGPGDVDWRFESRNQPPVGIDQGRDHAAEAARVCQLAGDELLGDRREAVGVAFINKGVTLAVNRPEALVAVHAGAVDALHRLRHEGGMETMLLGDRLEHVLKGKRAVGRDQRGAVLEVDFVLAGGDFVVARLNLDIHLIERHHHVLADGAGEVGGEIEVAAPVMGQGGDLVTILGEQEELQLGPDVVGVAELGQPLELAHQHTTGVAGEGLAIRAVDPADDPGGGEFASLPGHDRKGREIGIEVHVRFRDPGEAGNRRAVDPLPTIDNVLEDRGRDGNALDDAHHVSELQVDELDVVFLDLLEDFRLARALPDDLLAQRRSASHR